MTETLISLISILVGIIGANSVGLIFRKHSFGIVGNTIAGVFGSVFLIKSFGRFGFDPKSIIHLGNVNYSIFTINFLVSFLGGAIGVILISVLKNKIYLIGSNNKNK